MAWPDAQDPAIRSWNADGPSRVAAQRKINQSTRYCGSGPAGGAPWYAPWCVDIEGCAVILVDTIEAKAQFITVRFSDNAGASGK